MEICKLKIVYSQFAQIVPMKEAKEFQCKQRSNLNIPQWPCSSQRMTLVTSLTSKALLWLGGLARIRRPASATCWTMGWSLNSWQLIFFSTHLEPYTAEFSSETELPCWIRCTKYRATANKLCQQWATDCNTFLKQIHQQTEQCQQQQHTVSMHTYHILYHHIANWAASGLSVIKIY